jgi:hypothetical protein
MGDWVTHNAGGVFGFVFEAAPPPDSILEMYGLIRVWPPILMKCTQGGTVVGSGTLLVLKALQEKKDVYIRGGHVWGGGCTWMVIRDGENAAALAMLPNMLHYAFELPTPKKKTELLSSNLSLVLAMEAFVAGGPGRQMGKGSHGGFCAVAVAQGEDHSAALNPSKQHSVCVVVGATKEELLTAANHAGYVLGHKQLAFAELDNEDSSPTKHTIVVLQSQKEQPRGVGCRASSLDSVLTDCHIQTHFTFACRTVRSRTSIGSP